MGSDLSSDSGLIVPLYYMSCMFEGEIAVRFDDTMSGWLDFYSRVQKLDDEEFSKKTRFNRNEVDYLVNDFFGAYHSIRHIEGLETSMAFSKWIEQAEYFDLDHIIFINSIFNDTFWKNKIPKLKDIMYFEYCVHGDTWSIRGLLTASDGKPNSMSYEEFEDERRKKPCLIFEEGECFRTSLSAKGKRLKTLLGVSTFETSHWPVHSF
jgi:hypothetical protein